MTHQHLSLHCALAARFRLEKLCLAECFDSVLLWSSRNIPSTTRLHLIYIHMEGGGDEFMFLGELKIRDEVVTITGFSSQIINITNNHQQQGQRSQPQLFLSAATRYQQQVFSTRCDLLPTSIKHRSNVHLLSHSYCSWCL